MFERALRVASSVLGNIAAYAVLAMSLLILYDVTLRYGFNRATYYGTEISGYLLVAILFLGCGLTFREERHVAVRLLRMRLPPRVQLWLELVTLVLSLLVVAVLAWQGGNLVLKSFVRKATNPSILGTPFFIPQIVIPVGAAFLTLEIGLRIFQVARSLRVGRTGPGIAGETD